MIDTYNDYIREINKILKDTIERVLINNSKSTYLKEKLKYMLKSRISHIILSNNTFIFENVIFIKKNYNIEIKYKLNKSTKIEIFKYNIRKEKLKYLLN
jgi:hypothetical protein